MSNRYILTSILVMAVVTYLIRMLPMAIFRKKIKNRFIQSFLSYVPYSVLAAMTFPAIFPPQGRCPAPARELWWPWDWPILTRDF